MFNAQILNNLTAEPYFPLALASCRYMLKKLDTDKAIVAVGASIAGLPAGLILARYFPEQESLRIQSFFVLEKARRQGLGQELLDKLEQYAGEQGIPNIDTVYQSNLPSRVEVEALLNKAGWQEPTITAYTYMVEMPPALTGNLADAPEWLQENATLPPGLSLFNWVDLSPEEQVEVLRLVKTDPRYNDAVAPNFIGLEAINSVGIRYNGEIAGWQLTHRLRPDTIKYGNFFVRADVRNMGGVYNLIGEVIKRQILQGILRIISSVGVSKAGLLKFIDKFTAPYNPEIITHYIATKKVAKRTPEFKTLVELLQYRVTRQPEDIGYTYLVDGEEQEANLTYRELDVQTRQIAALLQSHGATGERVLLCLPQGLSYVTAFLGCLRAGAVVVCGYPPDPTRLSRSLPRCEAIINDSNASIVITTEALRPTLEAGLARPGVKWLSIEEAQTVETEPSEVAIDPEDLAFLMYTSGSTGTPRGVMVNHRAALANMRLFPGFIERPVTAFVSWLPLYHDLGFFFGILHPLHQGARAILLDPLAFVQRPIRWLSAISRYRASTTGVPNFAFDLCVRKTTPAERATLDLSCWNMALNGAEPIRPETLERFARAFAPYGFKATTLYPSYGMSEATCSISGGEALGLPVTVRASRDGLKHGLIIDTNDPKAAEFTGCGQSLYQQEIAIVNPQTLKRCAPSEIGEIWVKGPAIAQGYWNRPAETEEFFRAKLADTGEGDYLRTGDLGFLRDGELFIAGRLKDMMIVRGRNHYPQDVELTVERTHPAIRGGCALAFALEVAEEERLVLVAELNPDFDEVNLDEIYQKVRRAMAEQHDLELYALILIRPGTLPKTSSGKLQRRECKRLYLDNQLDIIKQWDANPENEVSVSIPEAVITEGTDEPTERLVASLKEFLAKRLSIPLRQISPTQTFAHYGMASLDAVALANYLEELTGKSLQPTLAWEYPTIEAMAKHLMGYPVQALPVPISTAKKLTEDDGIAIVGMGCRFPGGNNLQEFWELLCEGRDTVTLIPSSRWDIESFFSPDNSTPGKAVTRWGGFIEGLDQFDPLFFGISPREANHLDPRQRLILETAWEALEDAGIPPDTLVGSATGVYISNLTADYGDQLFEDVSRIESYSGAGTANSIIANRLSYFLDLRGPSVSLDTACSGSLVALHLACQSIRQGETGLALVGGVNINLNPGSNIFFSKVDALSPDGRCKVFDASANGIVRSEGAGIVVLKPLSKAMADHDRIYAVIRGSAVNSDGRSKGIMAPNPQAQEAVLLEAYRQAGRDPGQVQYVETHGTGTRLGDPIEVKALGKVLGINRPADKKCAIGSLKSNIGHTEAAAGVGGIIKTALSLKNRVLPPSLHFKQPNPLIPFEQLPVTVQQSLGAWPDETRTLLAGVSAFGFGGTNAHVVLEEAPIYATRTQPSARKPYLLPISAQNPESLRDLAGAYRDFLQKDEKTSLDDICYTASVRRNHFHHRLTVSGATRAELAEKLAAYSSGEHLPGLVAGDASLPSKVAFVFSGQGSHWLGMGLRLMEAEPVFRQTIHECERIILKLAGWSLLEELNKPESASRLNETDITQPAIFAVQVGLAALWRSWGIEPEAIIGQSLGEIAAAHVAGVLSLMDALRVVIERSKLMKRVAGQGKTALVELSLEQAQLAVLSCEDRVSVAGSTSPTSCVLSGDPATLQQILKALEKRGVFGRMLPGVDVAFHSPQMDALVPQLVAALADIKPMPANIKLYSTVTAGPVNGQELDASYWGRNLREPFLMSQTCLQLPEAGIDTIIEVSPHPVVATSLSQNFRQSGKTVMVLPSLKRDEADATTLLNSLGTLYTRGCALKWQRVYAFGECVSLPTYRWQRQTYWLNKLPSKGISFDYFTGKTAPNLVSLKGQKHTSSQLHPLVDSSVELSHAPGTFVFTAELSQHSPEYLAHHRVQDLPILPGAAYLEMVLAMAKQVYAGRTLHVGKVEFKEALLLPAEGSRHTQLVFTPQGSEIVEFTVSSKGAGGWTLHATGNISFNEAGQVVISGEELAATQARCQQELPTSEFYDRMNERGLQYGASFQSARIIRQSAGEALVKLELPADLLTGVTDYQIHPVLLDGCFQAVAAAIPTELASQRRYLPQGLECLHLYNEIPTSLWVHVKLSPSDQNDVLCAQLTLHHERGEVIGEISGFRLQGSKVLPRPEKIDDLLYQLEWEKTDALTVTNEPARWLVFGEANTVAQALISGLAGVGAQCEHISLNPQDSAAFETLIQQKLNEAAYRGIVYLGGQTQAETTSLEQALLDGVTPALYLAQALAKLNITHLPRLWLVTNGAQAIENKLTEAGIAQSGLWGLGGVIANEHPRLHCTRVDLSTAAGKDEINALISELYANQPENQVSLRGSSRYVLRFERATLTGKPVPQAELFRPEGSYLITGGLGGLGLIVARWMVEQGAKHLLLAGRSEPNAEAQALFAELNTLGAEVEAVALDITSESDLARVLEGLRDNQRTLYGVIHAAAVLDDALLLDQTPAKLKRVVAPKVSGAWHLHNLTRHIPLDFFVMFSSAASALGTPGQANYVAANTFLDTLVQYRAAEGLPATSINWGPWTEAGMAARVDKNDRFASKGMSSITPAQGLYALEQILRQGVTGQIGVFAANWPVMGQNLPLLSESRLGSRLVNTSVALEKVAATRTDIVKSSEKERQVMVEKYLSESLARAFGLSSDKFDPGLSLYNLGLDSLTAVELKNRVETELLVVIPLEKLLQGPSVRQLGVEILEQLTKEYIYR